MQDYWKDDTGDESFWEHEFNKDGTCMSTLDPACYSDYNPGQEVTDYFKRAVKLFKALPSYASLAGAGIVPSTTVTYTRAAIRAGLKAHHSHDVVIKCSKSGLNELWYHYNIQGSILSGTFAPVDPVDPPPTCPAAGIKYLPKNNTTPPPSNTKATTAGNPGSTGASCVLSSKGRVYVSTDRASDGGFLIRGGARYRGGGTPASYTATPNSNGLNFILSTSKGKCAIENNVLDCFISVRSPSSFSYDGSNLTYDGPNTSSATSPPSDTTQGDVYLTSRAISFHAGWVAV